MTGIGEDVDGLEHLRTVGGKTKWCSDDGKQYRSSSKNRKWNYQMIQKSHFEVYIQKKENGILEMCLHTRVHSSTVTIAKRYAQPR